MRLQVKELISNEVTTHRVQQQSNSPGDLVNIPTCGDDDSRMLQLTVDEFHVELFEMAAVVGDEGALTLRREYQLVLITSTQHAGVSGRECIESPPNKYFPQDH